jgi:hypothetical protein
MYRGWPSGEKIPIFESFEQVSPKLRSALEAEDAGWDLVDNAEDDSGNLLEIESETNEEERYFSCLVDSNGDLPHDVEENTDIVPVGEIEVHNCKEGSIL